MYRRSSVRIENILDDCITAIHEQGKNVADCLARHPNQRKELEPLLRLTVRLQAARSLQASPEFRRLSAIRMGNLTIARQRQNERSARPNFLERVRRRWRAIVGVSRRLTATIVASTVLVVSLLIGGGVVYASAGGLPGDALYPVKQAVERVQLAISLGDAGDARLRLSFAIRRLDEVAALLEKSQPQNIDQALSDYDAQMESIAAFLGEGSSLSADERIALASQLITVQAHHEEQFVVLLNQTPQDTRPAIELALAASRLARGQALQVLGQPGEPQYPYEPPESTQTATPQASPEPPTEAPSQTPTPTYSFIPSPPSSPSVTPTVEPTQLPGHPPSPRPSATRTVPPSLGTTRQPALTPSPWPTSTDRAPPSWTPSPWPTLTSPPPPNRTPLPPAWTPSPNWTPPPLPNPTLPPNWTPMPDRTPPPDWTPSPCPPPPLLPN